jgi:hypothetical protein
LTALRAASDLSSGVIFAARAGPRFNPPRRPRKQPRVIHKVNFKKNKSRRQTLQLVCATLDEMEEKYANAPRPFMYMVNGQGAFKYFEL